MLTKLIWAQLGSRGVKKKREMGPTGARPHPQINEVQYPTLGPKVFLNQQQIFQRNSPANASPINCQDGWIHGGG